MMPAGCWAGVWAVLWQSTLVNAVLLTAFYWLRVPTSGYSIAMPVAAPFGFAALASGSIIVGTILGLIAGLFAREWSAWAATAGFATAYVLYCYNWRVTYQGDVTAGIAEVPHRARRHRARPVVAARRATVEAVTDRAILEDCINA